MAQTDNLQLEGVSGRMQDVQIRRLPGLDDKLVGIVSLDDVAAKADSDTAGAALADISEPAEVNANAIAGVTRDLRGRVWLRLRQREEKLIVSAAHESLFRQM